MKAILVICFFGILVSAPLQAQSFLHGTWDNGQEQTTITLNPNQTGSYQIGNVTYNFEEAYTLTTVETGYRVEFKITMSGVEQTLYAMIKEINSSKIKFIVFLVKEDADQATAEQIDTGIILEKN